MYIVFSTHNINNELLNEYFHSLCFKNELKRRLEGSVRQSLSFNNLCNFNITITNKTEIYSCAFFAMNHKLETQEAALSKLIKLKQFLLKNMFI